MIANVDKECIVADKYDLADKRFDGIFGERSAQSRKHLYESERYAYRSKPWLQRVDNSDKASVRSKASNFTLHRELLSKESANGMELHVF